MINFDNRPPGINASSDEASARSLIAGEVRDVTEYGAQLAYYGPNPMVRRMFVYPIDRSKSWGNMGIFGNSRWV